MKCDRCGQQATVHTMSRFNTDDICMECDQDERAAPGYAAARKAEEDSVRRGVYAFEGVGLSPEDAAFLAARRAERAVTK